MTIVTIKALAKDVSAYNRNMSALSTAFEPLARQFGGTQGMGPGAEPQKPTLSFAFNDLATATSFLTAAAKLAGERKFAGLGPRKLPAVLLNLEDKGSGSMTSITFEIK